MAFAPTKTINVLNRDYFQIETTFEQYKSYWKCLNEQRKEGSLCDVIIRCRGSTYHAHKCVLASTSPYFKALFSSPFCIAANEQKIAKLDQFSEESITLLLDIIYAHATVKPDNVAEMLRLADFLQYDWLLNQLIEAIRTTLNDTNCFTWYEIAKVFGIEKLSVLAESYIRINYEKLLAIDEYKNRAIAMENNDFFDKDVVFYCGCKTFYVIDVEKKSCVEHKQGPCAVDAILPTIDHMNTLENFEVTSCFARKDELFVVTTFNDRIPAINFGEAIIEIYSYKQLAGEYELVCSMDQFNVLYDEHLFRDYVQYEELATWRAEHGGFSLHQAVHDNVDNVYLLFGSSKIDEVVINKYSLTKKCCSDNYIRLHADVTNSKFQFVQSKELGFLLFQGLEQIYLLEEFNFQDRGSLTLPELNVGTNMADSTVCESSNNTWRVVSFLGEIYYFGVIREPTKPNESQLRVLKLNTEKVTWTFLNDFPIVGDLTNVFVSQEKIFVVLSSIRYAGICCCVDTRCDHDHYKTDDVYEYLCQYEPGEGTLSSFDVKVPVSCFEAHRPFTIPAHVLL